MLTLQDIYELVTYELVTGNPMIGIISIVITVGAVELVRSGIRTRLTVIIATAIAITGSFAFGITVGNTLFSGIAIGFGIASVLAFADIYVIGLAHGLARSRFTARSSVKCPPGNLLLRLANSICRKATTEMVNLMVADMRVEHFEALKEHRRVKAQWIRVLHYFSIARALTVDRLIGAALNYLIGVFRAGKS